MPISTGYAEFDEILGSGGYPAGGIVEIYGSTFGRVSTLVALSALKASLARGEAAAFINTDPEYQVLDLDESYFKDMDYFTPTSAEEALEVCRILAGSGVRLIVMGPVHTMTPETPYASLSTLMSRRLGGLSNTAANSGSCILIPNSFSDQGARLLYGGNALGFYSSLRVEIQEKGLGEVVAHTRKNRNAPPFRDARFKLCG